ncbi:hypothetical protein M441DRAFT_44705 [Trichoderma asperellum CBS 433.97]|uniref:Uncharacterized protein n=1 Tax=Trichoderma asperellum (strain ATCC 204424 / CBS 433.97 / NBRC 101777) TaxID=1042311 RepID=A0A2T3ZIN4_TRIA4|nr:hypothetical protein M441DRAFT_44705 [Trichoderma asperellum CBS 433.97]PTB44675.1 hypothetical protein M441DRAFT_44705 [Trichoderma asperellum CBS 433.97]
MSRRRAYRIRHSLLQQQRLFVLSICLLSLPLSSSLPLAFVIGAVWLGWWQIGSTSGRQARRGVPEMDGGCEMRCAEMTEPNVSQGAPTTQTDDVASWQTQEKRRAMQLKEDRGRPSMGLAKAGFEAAESRLDDFRFSPDSRWANGWPEMGWAGGRH